MKSAVIVGGSTGIGAATRKSLDDAGWDTISIDRTNGVDIEDRDVYGAALDLHLNRNPDAIIYSAGHVAVEYLAATKLDSWDHHLEVNLTGAFRLLSVAARVCRPCPIVLVSSTAGTRPSPKWAPYAAAKAALINLAETAHAELGPIGYRIYCVTPGRCATPLRAVLAPDENPGLIMQPREVAAVIQHLLADHAGVLAGRPIRVAR